MMSFSLKRRESVGKMKIDTSMPFQPFPRSCSELLLPLWIAVSIKRFWGRSPEIRFLLFDQDLIQVATTEVLVNWEYDDSASLLPFVMVRMSLHNNHVEGRRKTICASVETEGSYPVFTDGKDIIGHSDWGSFLTWGVIYNACGQFIARLSGWPFTLSRRVHSADGGLVARFHHASLGDDSKAFLKNCNMKKCYVLDSENELSAVNLLVVADWLCMIAVAYGARPDASS